MPVDSFTYLPRSFRAEYENVADSPDEAVWAPLGVPIGEANVALVTSAGLFLEGEQEPFDVDRERQEPLWGDPTYRIVPRTVRQDQIGASHLHLNTRDFGVDFNVALPIRALEDIAAAGGIGSVADEHYSLMGYQARDLREWRQRYGPEIVGHLKTGGVDAVILAPA